VWTLLHLVVSAWRKLLSGLSPVARLHSEEIDKIRLLFSSNPGNPSSLQTPFSHLCAVLPSADLELYHQIHSIRPTIIHVRHRIRIKKDPKHVFHAQRRPGSTLFLPLQCHANEPSTAAKPQGALPTLLPPKIRPPREEKRLRSASP